MTAKNRAVMSLRNSSNEEDTLELRKGQWTLEEDNLLIHYIASHGGGNWNALAKCAGLRRTGKSCRLRWLNYLKPDIKRGNLTPQEQILILELHSKWGNRWSKIAQHLPGRTDNEIKNYWRTRVQKQARQLRIDSNSAKFVEAIRSFGSSRLTEKIEQTSSSMPSPSSSSSISAMEKQSSALPSQTPIHENDFASPLSKACKLSEAKVSHQGLSSETSVAIEVDHDCYHVETGNSCFCGKAYSLTATSAFDSEEFSMSECELPRNDWFSDDVACSLTDELWTFRKF